MAPTYRKPLRRVTSNGAEIPNVFSVRITRGWDQMLAKADITVPYPPVNNMGKGAKVTIAGGITSMPTRFTGYVTGYGAELWPSTWTFPCEDVLWLTKFYRPSANHDLSGMTDEDAVVFILTTMGFAFTPSLILGTGKVIGAAASASLTWSPGTTAMEMIRRIDEVSIVDGGGGLLTQFRTWADFGGQVRRNGIANLPGATAARSFVEGVDLESGSARVEAAEPHTEVTVIGSGVSSTLTGTNPFAVTPNPWSYLYPMLQQTTGSDLGTAAVAQFMLQRLNMNLVTIDFKTWRDDLIGAIETVSFDSDHLRLTLNSFVQNVTTSWFETGEFSQQLVLTSVRELNTNTATTGIPGTVSGPPIQFRPINGDPITPDPPEVIPVQPDTVTAAFNVAYIDVELVIIADVETLLYTAVCHDVSTSSGGTITTRAWTTAGGATPSTGSDINFNPSWTDLAAATVTLTVTDSLSNVDAITIPISLTMGVPVRTRDIFAAATGEIEAFSGADRTWQIYTTGITAAGIVANGPLWAQGDTVYRSSDYLATAPSTSVPSASVDVTSIWTELDLNANAVAVGLDNGRIALSSDAAATWTVLDGPDMGNPVLKIILSRWNPGQIHVITTTGFYSSSDAGANWALIRAGDYRDLDENQFRSWAIEVVSALGDMIEAASGSAITGSGADDLVCVTSHILADRGYALAADGSTYLLATDGATALTAGTAIPSGSPQHRGMYRDGGAADIVYFAAGSGGVWKTTDGFRATYYQLRKSSIGNAGSGPWPMIGAGLLQSQTPVGAASRVYVLGYDNELIYKSTDGGVTFTSLSLPSGWSFINGFDALSVTGGNDIIWAGNGGVDVAKSTDGGVTWTSYDINALTNGSTGNIAIIDANTVFATGATSGVAVTYDAGANWAAFTPSNIAQPVSAMQGGAKVWTSSSASPLTTKKRYLLDGTSPETITHFSNSSFVLAITDAFAFLMTGASAALRTINGTTVTSVPTGSSLEGTISYIGAYAAPDLSFILARISQFSGGGIGEIWRSTDAGSSWTLVETDTQLNVNGASTYDGIIRHDPNDPTKIFTASGTGAADGVVWYSSDSGVTWTVVGTITGEQNLAAIRVCSG